MRAFISRPRRGAQRLLAIGGVVIAASALVFLQVGAAGAVDVPAPTPSSSADAAPVAPEPSAGAVAPEPADATAAADPVTEEIVDPTDQGAPSESEGPTADPGAVGVPTPVLHVSGGNCVAGQTEPVSITWTWDVVEGESFALGYNFHYVDANGVWRQVFGGEATPSITAGTYTVPASALDLPVGRYAIIGGLVGGSVIGEAASAEFTVAQCGTEEPPATVFDPPQPTFEVLPCLQGTPQTRVNLPAVDPAKEGSYTVGGKQASGTIVVPGAGVIRPGFQFIDGVSTPPKNWTGLSGFVPNAEECAAVNPPVDPPVDPPVTGGNPTDGGNTGGSTGGSTPSTTPAVKNGSPLTGTGAPGTGARGATAERANAIVAAGGIGTAALGLIAVAVLAYRRYRSA